MRVTTVDDRCRPFLKPFFDDSEFFEFFRSISSNDLFPKIRKIRNRRNLSKTSRKKKVDNGHPRWSLASVAQKPKALSQRSEPRGWRRWSRAALFNKMKKIDQNFDVILVSFLVPLGSLLASLLGVQIGPSSAQEAPRSPQDVPR